MKNRGGFALLEGLLILVIVGLLGGTGWYAWHVRNSTDKTNSIVTQTSNSTDISATRAADPYAGWKTYTSTNKKLIFKYPTDWQLSDKSAQAGDKNDFLEIKTSGGFNLSIQSAVPVGAASNESKKISSDPVKFIGKPVYILYESFASAIGSNTNTIDSAVLTTDPTKIVLPSAGSADGAVWNINWGYSDRKAIQDPNKDPNFKDSKLIIESMTY